jgi:hypothetical protein
VAVLEQLVAGLAQCGLDDLAGECVGLDVEAEAPVVADAEPHPVLGCRLGSGRFRCGVGVAGRFADAVVVGGPAVGRCVGRVVGGGLGGVGVGVVGEGVGGEGAVELVDGEHAAEVADLAVGPPGGPAGDGGHLVDGEFAASEGVDAGGEFVDAFGDGDDLAGSSGGEPGAPGEEQCGGVHAGAAPVAGVGDHRDGDVDEAGVQCVEVSGDVVQFLVQIERCGVGDVAGRFARTGWCGFGRGVLDVGHDATLAHTRSRNNLVTNKYSNRERRCEGAVRAG